MHLQMKGERRYSTRNTFNSGKNSSFANLIGTLVGPAGFEPTIFTRRPRLAAPTGFSNRSRTSSSHFLVRKPVKCFWSPSSCRSRLRPLIAPRKYIKVLTKYIHYSLQSTYYTKKGVVYKDIILEKKIFFTSFKRSSSILFRFMHTRLASSRVSYSPQECVPKSISLITTNFCFISRCDP